MTFIFLSFCQDQSHENTMMIDHQCFVFLFSLHLRIFLSSKCVPQNAWEDIGSMRRLVLMFECVVTFLTRLQGEDEGFEGTFHLK